MQIVEIDREALWSIWMVLCAVPFEKRDSRWEHASTVVKKVLNESKNVSENGSYFPICIQYTVSGEIVCDQTSRGY